MRRLTFTLLLLALPALAGQVETARDAVTDARHQLDVFTARQGELESQLQALGARISELKSKPRLLGGELDAALKQSQELSAQLTQVASQKAAAATALSEKQHVLESALTGELARLRAGWETTRREDRPGALARMRALRQERDALRVSQLGPLTPLPKIDASDDPEDLLEEADAVKDREDKLRRELTALDQRLREAREEQELDRRMGELSGDQRVFDDSERNLRLDRDPHVRLPGPNNGFTTDMSATGGPGAPGPGAGPNASGGAGAPPPGATPPAPPAKVGAASGGSADDLDDLSALETRRKALEAQAAQLHQTAASLEAKAKSLAGSGR